MTITNPVVIKFSNEQIRTAADVLSQNYYRAKSVVDYWTALEAGTLILKVAVITQR